jgi:competence ComEA-like helix-hairpin-helix protein
MTLQPANWRLLAVLNLVLAVCYLYIESRKVSFSAPCNFREEYKMSQKFVRTSIAVLLGLTVAFGVFPARAADGTLDSTFGNGGIVTTDIGENDDLGLDVERQPDGRIIMAGTSSNADGTDNDFGLVRYNPDGSLDTTFDTDGKVTTSFGAGYDLASALVLQADGKIIAAGHSDNSNEADFALARYNLDGSLDTTFGLDGKVTTPIGSGDDFGIDLALQGDGKIVVAGFSFNDATSGDMLVLARYNEDGSLDETFGSQGIVTADFGCAAAGYALVLQPDGKIIVAGHTCGLNSLDFALVRFNSDGSTDISFDQDGIVTTDFNNSYDSGHAVALQPDGKIIVAGHSYTDANVSIDFALARYNPDGSPDTSFDEDGKVTTDLGGWRDFVYAISLQPDSKILVAGEQWQQEGGTVDFALARYNTDGSLDAGFGTDGRMITDISSGDYANALALQPDGRILVGGFSDNGFNFDFALARYDASGPAIEATFDVRPGKFPNRIELEKNLCKGKDDDNLPVAILTTPEFDALRLVDVTSLQIGDPALGGTAAPIHSQGRDIDRDGDRDVWLLFSLCDLVTNEALNQNSTELVLSSRTLEGVPFTARDSVEIIRQRPPKPVMPEFIYPVDGQVLDYEGSYLFKVKPVPSAEGFLWGFFQNGEMVWENYRDEGILSWDEYGIHPGTLAHSRFVPGPVEVWVRASINGQWTDAAVITIHLQPTGGPLDSTFGDGGRVITDFGNGHDFGNDLVLQPDGKLLVAGTAFNGIDEDLALARYNSDGSLDPGFGNGGKVTTDFSGVFRVNINTAAAQTLETLPGIGPTLAQAIVAYRNQNGLFGTIEDVKMVSGLGPGVFDQIQNLITVGNDSGQALALLPDGRILVAGGSEHDFALTRYHSDGSLDLTFGTNGHVITDLVGFYGIGLDIALQPDGKILVSGFGGEVINIALARYHSDGSLDTEFGTNGIVLTHISGEDYGRTVSVQSDGKILVTGQTFVLSKGYNFVLVRYSTDGSRDASFGTGGIVSTGFGPISEDGISDALLQPDGKILAVGLTDAAPDRIFDFALARYNSDGSLDTTFGIEGKVTTSFGSHDAFGAGAVLQPDGRIIVVGQNLTPDSGFNFALARYNNDGSLDTSFGDNGRISTDMGGGDDIAWSVLLQPDGKVVLAGTSQLNFALARYPAQGQAIEVTIDIKPGSDTNHINPNSRGRTNVAILSTPEFDALAMIDRTTLRFGRTGEEESLHSCKEKGRDVNRDGLRDLICLFSIPATGFMTGDQVGALTGQTVDGIALRGSDPIRVGRESQDD